MTGFLEDERSLGGHTDLLLHAYDRGVRGSRFQNRSQVQQRDVDLFDILLREPGGSRRSQREGLLRGAGRIRDRPSFQLGNRRDTRIGSEAPIGTSAATAFTGCPDLAARDAGRSPSGSSGRRAAWPSAPPPLFVDTVAPEV
jgi:hypothetical protein